jgi:hypothetical protein
MSKGQKGLSGSDRGFAQIEKDLRDMRRSGESRATAPITLAEQLERVKLLETFDGRYPNYGAWEYQVYEDCRDARVPLGLISESGYYPRMWKADGFDQKITPLEFSKMLRGRMKF